MQTLAEFLGQDEPTTLTRDVPPLDASEFCRRILDSKEFRTYLLNGVTLGNLPPAIMLRLMDHGWGKPVDRLEHTGANGSPIITEVRRVIVHADEVVQDEELRAPKLITH